MFSLSLGQVIPQLIARIDHPRRLVAKLIHDLLTDVGKQHPQVPELCTFRYVVAMLDPCPPLPPSGSDLPSDSGQQEPEPSEERCSGDHPPQHERTQ